MKRALAVTLVSAQFLLLMTLALLPHGTLWVVNIAVVAAGIVLALVGAVFAVLGVLGLGPALTASPIPREHAPLVTGGVYGIVRSPIYAGLMTGGVGLMLLGASVWHIIAWLTLALLLAGKARWEERMLVAEHPDYAAYGAQVGRFLPGIGRLKPQT
ncbi:MAG: isoprenylcysteine carboxylmethyltransferase family protein [Cryobacterium sp.]|nr:isoprenylcysteine carboxylmethyltransferase family protein [Cryobacterium sp.]